MRHFFWDNVWPVLPPESKKNDLFFNFTFEDIQTTIFNTPTGDGSLTEGLCFNVMIGVTIMVVILAIGSAMLWTAQRLMNVSQVRKCQKTFSMVLTVSFQIEPS